MLGVFLIGYSYSITSAEDRKKIVEAIKEANYFWVIVSLLLGFSSHLFRAIRWNLLLKPMGYKPHLINNIMAIFAAYLANLGIPRSGELLRATTISTYENIPFQKGFGTIIAERVIDVIMLLLIVLITGILQTDIILDYFAAKQINFNKLIGLGLVLIIGGGLFLFFIKKAKSGLLLKIKHIVQGLIEGVSSIFQMKNKGLFLIYTFAIWFLYVAMFWVVKFSMPETAELPVSAILAAFVAGAFAMTATNGGIGLYPIAVSNILLIYGISKTSTDAFGWLMWSSQTIMIVLFGALSFFLLPVFNKNK